MYAEAAKRTVEASKRPEKAGFAAGQLHRFAMVAIRHNISLQYRLVRYISPSSGRGLARSMSDRPFNHRS